MALGQSSNTGFPPFGSVQSGGFDSVNLHNLNVNFTVPIVSHLGRGQGFQYSLAYNSLVWTLTSTSWSPATNWGWTKDGPTGSLSYEKTTFPCITSPDTLWTNYIFIDPAGTTHTFGVAKYQGPCDIQSSLKGYATDASGYYIDISSQDSPVLYSPDGTKFTYSVTGVGGGRPLMSTDPNGNELISTTNAQTQETDWPDTMGQVAVKITSQFNGPNGLLSETDYSRLAVGGIYRTFAVKYQYYSVQTNFGCSGVGKRILLTVWKIDFRYQADI